MCYICLSVISLCLQINISRVSLHFMWPRPARARSSILRLPNICSRHSVYSFVAFYKISWPRASALAFEFSFINARCRCLRLSSALGASDLISSFMAASLILLGASKVSSFPNYVRVSTRWVRLSRSNDWALQNLLSKLTESSEKQAFVNYMVVS